MNENDAILESKTIRRVSYNLEKQGDVFYVVKYNSIGIPEVLAAFNSNEDAKSFFDSYPNSKVK